MRRGHVHCTFQNGRLCGRRRRGSNVRRRAPGARAHLAQRGTSCTSELRRGKMQTEIVDSSSENQLGVDAESKPDLRM
eukprot:6205737-Pleurochrysis_carterae.AAC.1